MVERKAESDPGRAVQQLLEGFSLEITAAEADIEAVRAAADSIPSGTAINLTFLASEDMRIRVEALRVVCGLGFAPVPHISARRLDSEGTLDGFLAELDAAKPASRHVFVVAGDDGKALGPYSDAMAVIRSPLLSHRNVQQVSIAGYPEGHPEIDDSALWSSLLEKSKFLSERGLAGEIVTQFGFDADAVVAWISAVRERDIQMPIRVGLPGPAGVRRLLAYAKRCGVATSAGIAKKYGLSLTNLWSTVGPEAFLDSLAAAYDPALHGSVAVHFYTFGGLSQTVDWIAGVSAPRTDHQASVR
jgi:methylenetetrahydrofolate reductase (NADPH)